MKENWIRKLKNILNEYEDYKEEKYWRRNYIWVCYWKDNPRISADRVECNWVNDCLFEDESRAIIISKGYNFIKWLVWKNKIDIERLHKIVDYMLVMKGNYVNAHDYNSDCLLMLLAISKTPIEDLISYLK